MREMQKLAKEGWWKAMIHQGTLSLILTLDDFLISGPHLSTKTRSESITNSNIFFLTNHRKVEEKIKDGTDSNRIDVSTYYVIRPHIRGILYGLNPLYQMSLYVPCKDSRKMALYREIISKIDIDGQFFQDRIYWNFEALKNDIMDTRLACLIYTGNICLENDWLAKISIEYKPFFTTIDSDITESSNLFELVEMRNFLEDVHQRYFSLLNESKKLYFSNVIRLHVDEKASVNTHSNGIMSTSGFFSTVTSSQVNNDKRFISEGHLAIAKETKRKIELMFKITSCESQSIGKLPDIDLLLDEYEDIIQEQLDINHDISHVSSQKSSFAKTLCRWNTITERKSEVLRLLMSHGDKNCITERLRQLNSVYCMRKFKSENDLFVPEQSVKSSESTSSETGSDLSLSNDPGKENCDGAVPQFTIWYTKKT